jgi:hypothetical protein
MVQKIEADSLANLVRMSGSLRLMPARNPWLKFVGHQVLQEQVLVFTRYRIQTESKDDIWVWCEAVCLKDELHNVLGFVGKVKRIVSRDIHETLDTN